MPKIKTKRTDILRNPEVENLLAKADPWLACLIALCWMFGKRINEYVRLKRDDVWIEGDYLFARFLVSKKHTPKEPPVPHPYLKKIRKDHPGVQYVYDYIGTIKQGYLFPAETKSRIRIIKMKDKTYTYQIEGGHIHVDTALYYLKKLSKDVWFHLFRESLATRMAEKGATEEELMHWFDWDRVDTAHEYVKRGTKLTEKWSERAW
jgi:integrase